VHRSGEFFLPDDFWQKMKGRFQMNAGSPAKIRRSVRQTIEGMPLVFNPAGAGNLQATIQFNVSGLEPGYYYLDIKEGVCRFNVGRAAHPTLTINTPSEI
jgi:hypothetical protein